MNDRLHRWLRKQIDERAWSDSEFARRAELSKSYVSLVMNHQRSPSADFCLAAARALHVDPAFVLGLAGLLPPTTQQRRAADPILDEACDILERMPRERQTAALDVLHGLAATRSAERPPGVHPTAMEQAPESTAEAAGTPSANEGALPGQEIEQMFYRLLSDLSHPDNPHRRAYDALWDAARTIEEKKLLARMLAAAAQRDEGGQESQDD